jgi:trehalose 6-phosphate synthase
MPVNGNTSTAGPAKADLVVVSNRGPFSFVEEDDGTLSPRPGGGGLAPSLAAALSGHSGTTWVAAALTEGDRRGAAGAEGAGGAGGALETGQPGLSLRLVSFEPEVLGAAYDVVANATLWFVLHGLFDASRRPIFDRVWFEAWRRFQEYNEAFAAATAEVAAEGAVVLVNDYHLDLVGGWLARERPDLKTVHFSHTPFATPEELAMLPPAVARELVEGMAGFGACGFHSPRWEGRFRRCCEEAGGIAAPATFHMPLGADEGRLSDVAATPECAEALGELEELVGGRALLLRNDRIELSKNILRGLRAFDALLEEHPELRGRVVHVMRCYASREGLPEYLAYRSEIEQLAALVNERWAERCGGRDPVRLDVGDDFPSTVAALRRYDALLVNPVRDGMNLVAKEGPLLNERDGAVVLSTEAGAYDELGELVFGVHPFDVVDTASQIHAALLLQGDERAERASRLRRLAAMNPPAEWLKKVLEAAVRPGN